VSISSGSALATSSSLSTSDTHFTLEPKTVTLQAKEATALINKPTAEKSKKEHTSPVFSISTSTPIEQTKSSEQKFESKEGIKLETPFGLLSLKHLNLTSTSSLLSTSSGATSSTFMNQRDAPSLTKTVLASSTPSNSSTPATSPSSSSESTLFQTPWQVQDFKNT
jgi:hypothetical protein